MRYTFEIHKPKKGSYTEYEWIGWTSGSLEDCLSDFFYYQSNPVTDSQDGLRITWHKPGGK